MMLPLKKTSFGIILCVLIVLIYLGIAFFANRDAPTSFYLLHMDERTSFGGVRSILDSKNLPELIDHASGPDHRYGRIMFNAEAVVSWLPKKWWGEYGQIVATRTLQSFFLIAAYLIFVLTFIRNDYFRALALLLLIALPETHYYTTMPKPEPEQLFFLALFLYFAKKREYRFGFYWFFLGLCFASKISAAVWVGMLGLFSMFFWIRDCAVSKRAAWREMISGAAGFLCGFVTSEIWLLTKGPGEVSNWLRNIRLNVNHGEDDIHLNAFGWVRELLANWSAIPKPFLILSLALVGVLIGLGILEAVRQKKKSWVSSELCGLIPFVLGLTYLLVIILKTKRLWFFYVHPAAVLMSFAAVSVAESFWRCKRKGLIAKLCLAVLVLNSAIFLLPAAFKKYVASAHVTKTPAFVEKNQQITYALQFLQKINQVANSNVGVLVDSRLLLVEQEEGLVLENFWGPFVFWDKEWHLVLALDSTINPDRPLLNSGALSYQIDLASRMMYPEFVSIGGQPCPNPICYDEIPTPSPGLRIYARRDIAPMVRQLS